MAKRTGLGKGLGAIFGEDVVENQENVSRETSGRQTDANSQKEESPGKEYMMKMSLIEPNTEPRPLTITRTQHTHFAQSREPQHT